MDDIPYKNLKMLDTSLIDKIPFFFPFPYQTTSKTHLITSDFDYDEF